MPGVYPQVITWLNYDYLENLMERNNGRQVHGRILRTWRWERPFYKLVGDNWPSLARDVNQWDSMQTELIHKRSTCR